MKENLVPIYQLPDFKRRLATLTDRERLYFSIMRGQYGVLYIKAKPGVAKSAIARSIAEKMGCYYIDIRLSMADETDMQFPNLKEKLELDYDVIEHALPEWAVISNQQPTIIHFEELNRAPLAVRNAALQILLERGIGFKFEFNENVFMMASGNLGTEDGTDVEEFDNALNNRLIHFEHSLTDEEWLKWGTGNIHPDILSFIEFYPMNLYVEPNEYAQTYATPRSWHMLSEFIKSNFGGGPKVHTKETTNDLKEIGKVIEDEDGNILHFRDGYKTDEKGDLIEVKLDAGSTETEIKTKSKYVENWGEMDDFITIVLKVARSYVGDKASIAFTRFLEERTRVTLKDVIERYATVKKELLKFNRDKYSELISEAKKAKIDTWSSKQIENFASFLKECQADERVGFILHTIDHANNNYKNGVQTPELKKLLRMFPDDLKKIKVINNANKNRK